MSIADILQIGIRPTPDNPGDFTMSIRYASMEKRDAAMLVLPAPLAGHESTAAHPDRPYLYLPVDGSVKPDLYINFVSSTGAPDASIAPTKNHLVNAYTMAALHRDLMQDNMRVVGPVPASALPQVVTNGVAPVTTRDLA